MKRIITIILSSLVAYAKGSVVTNDFLDKVAVIESNNNPNAVGDRGRAIGAYQMHEPAFREACTYLGIKTGQRAFWNDIIAADHKRYAKTDYAKTVARAYFEILENQMKKRGIIPTEENLYMAYNMGFEGARKYRFNPRNLTLDRSRAKILARACDILNR